jgi:hypothetical protein
MFDIDKLTSTQHQLARVVLREETQGSWRRARSLTLELPEGQQHHQQ